MTPPAFCVCVAIAASLVGCADEFPQHVDLQAAAQGVDFAIGRPSSNMYRMVGLVTGVAAAKDVETAEEAARNDLRNKAASLGASLVTIEQDLGEAMPLQDKTKVKLVGHAYKAID